MEQDYIYKLSDEIYWAALLCVGLDRRCTAVHTCLCVFFNMWSQANLETARQKYRILQKKNMLTEAYHVHSDGALCFYISLQPLQASHYYYHC